MHKADDKEVTCNKHNVTYMAEVIFIGSVEKIQPCPQCMTDIKNERIEKEGVLKKQKEVEFFNKNFGSSNIPPRFSTRTFDNFRCDSTLKSKALNTAREYLAIINKNISEGANLILSGKPGTGKTHIACAIAKEFAKKDTVLFITVSAMIRKIRESYRQNADNTEQEIIDYFSNIGMVIIDEIGVQKGTESEENLLFEIINNRYSNFKSTILISNLNAKEMKSLVGERVFDRMLEGGGKFIYFNWESYRPQVSGDNNLLGADKTVDTSNSLFDKVINKQE